MINNTIIGQSDRNVSDFVATNGATTGGVGNVIRGGGGFGGTIVSSADPRLGALASNGGPTKTMVPQPGSPAIDAGDDAVAASLTTDQRGTASPIVHDRCRCSRAQLSLPRQGTIPANTDEERAISIHVLSNDAAVAPATTLTVLSVNTAGTLGSVTNNGSNVEYDPAGALDFLAMGETTTDTFFYTVVDEFNAKATALVTVTITGVNDAPNAADDSGSGFATDEDTAFTTANVLANDSDPDNTDSVVYVSHDDTSTTGIVTYNGDGTFLYDPNGKFEGLNTGQQDTDSFIYVVRDNSGVTDSGTVTITISGQDDPLQANDDDGTANEDGPAITIDLTGNDTDPDYIGDLEILSIDVTGTLGSVTINSDNDSVTYDTNGQFESLAVGQTATDTFSYTVRHKNRTTEF